MQFGDEVILFDNTDDDRNDFDGNGNYVDDTRLTTEEEARSEEAKTDNILDGVKNEDEDEPKEDEQEKTQEERIDETVAKRKDDFILYSSYRLLFINH